MHSPGSLLAVLGGGVVGTACALALLAGSASTNTPNPCFLPKDKEKRQKMVSASFSGIPALRTIPTVEPVPVSIPLMNDQKSRIEKQKRLPVTVISRSRNFYHYNIFSHICKDSDLLIAGNRTNGVESDYLLAMTKSCRENQAPRRSEKRCSRYIRLGGSLDFVPHVAQDRLLVKSYEEYIDLSDQMTEETKKKGIDENLSSASLLCTALSYPLIPPTMCCCVTVTGLSEDLEKHCSSTREQSAVKSTAAGNPLLYSSTKMTEGCNDRGYRPNDKQGMMNLTSVKVLNAFINRHRGARRCCGCGRILKEIQREGRNRDSMFSLLRKQEMPEKSGNESNPHACSAHLSSSTSSSSFEKEHIIERNDDRQGACITNKQRVLRKSNAECEEACDASKRHETSLERNVSVQRSDGKQKSDEGNAGSKRNCGGLPWIPMVIVFTRGLTLDGFTPAEWILLQKRGKGRRNAFRSEEDEEISKCSHSSHFSSPVAVLTVCGPVLPREWAHQNVSFCDEEADGAKSHVASLSSFLSASSSSSPYSGASFTISLSNPEEELIPYYYCCDPTCCRSLPSVHEVLFAQVKRLFPRENISYFLQESRSVPLCGVYGTPIFSQEGESGENRRNDCRKKGDRTLWNGGYVLSIVNGVLPLLSFGGGLVHSSYASSSATSLSRRGLTETTTTGALFSYAQNAVAAVEELLQKLWESRNCCLENGEATTSATWTEGSSSKNTPFCNTPNATGIARWTAAPSSLPPTVTSTIFLACLDRSSREFILGMQMDYHFRKEDALNAVFHDSSVSRSCDRNEYLEGTKKRIDDPEGPAKDIEHDDSLEEIEIKTTMRKSAAAGKTSRAALKACNFFPNTAVASSVEGLRAILERNKAHAPFFEVLMETYDTVLRASLTGQRLAHRDGYAQASGSQFFDFSPTRGADSSEIAEQVGSAMNSQCSNTAVPHAKPSLTHSFHLLDGILKVDQAMLHESEEGLREASNELARWIDGCSS